MRLEARAEKQEPWHDPRFQLLRIQYSLHFRFLLTIVNELFAVRPRCGSLAKFTKEGLAEQMKVLVIGGGGREHALVWSISRSRRVSEVVCAPGNAGIAQLARCVPASQKDLDDLLRVTAAERPDLVVVGPELPLSLGLVDELQRRSIPVFGPTQKAAQLESSKAFAKRFMQRHQIPTAAYAVATSEQQAMESIDLFHLPVVIKADGLASGKGVLMCETRREATEAISGLMAGKLLG